MLPLRTYGTYPDLVERKNREGCARVKILFRDYNRYSSVFNGIMLAPRAVSVCMRSHFAAACTRGRLSPGRVPITLRALVARKPRLTYMFKRTSVRRESHTLQTH